MSPGGRAGACSSRGPRTTSNPRRRVQGPRRRASSPGPPGTGSCSCGSSRTASPAAASSPRSGPGQSPPSTARPASQAAPAGDAGGSCGLGLGTLGRQGLVGDLLLTAQGQPEQGGDQGQPAEPEGDQRGD